MKRLIPILLALWIVLLIGCDSTSNPQSTAESQLETEGTMKKTASLEFHSFDGGGPSFTAILEDSSIVSVKETTKYSKANHAELHGAGFTVTFTFDGCKPGTTGLKIEERSPIAGNYDRTYTVTVDADLRVSIEALEVLEVSEDS